MVVPLFVIGCLEGLDWERGGGGKGGTNVSCQLKFCPFVSQILGSLSVAS